MDDILCTVHWPFALVYLNDIVILLKSQQAHDKHVRAVLTLLNDADIPMKLKKCEFFSSAIDYLGHIVPPGYLAVLQHTTDAGRDMKPSTNITELR